MGKSKKEGQPEVWLALSFGIEDFCPVEDQETTLHRTKEEAREMLAGVLVGLRDSDPSWIWEMKEEEDERDESSFFLFYGNEQEDASWGVYVKKLAPPA